MGKSFLIGILIFASAVQFAEARQIRMLTWNVYMLPQPIKFSNQKYRIPLMVKHLGGLNHDVVVLQESFMSIFNESLKLALSKKYPYQKTLGFSGHWSQVMNSGVTVLSRIPLTKVAHEFYDSCSGADCFASKGVLLVRLEIPGRPIHLAMTHLQAGQDEDGVHIRKLQLAQIRALLESNKESNVPQILIGDLNIDALKAEEFPQALSFLQMENSPLLGEIQSSKSLITTCLGKEGSQKSAWIDHFLIRQNGEPLKVTDKRIRLIQDRVNEEWCDLSDHRPVEMVLDLQTDSV